MTLGWAFDLGIVVVSIHGTCQQVFEIHILFCVCQSHVTFHLLHLEKLNQELIAICRVTHLFLVVLISVIFTALTIVYFYGLLIHRQYHSVFLLALEHLINF